MPSGAALPVLLPSGPWQVWSVSTESWKEKHQRWPGAWPLPSTSHKRSQQPETAGQKVAASAEATCPCGGRAFSLGLPCGVGRGLQPPWAAWVLLWGGGRAAIMRRILRLEEGKLQKAQGAGLSWLLADGKLEPTP